MRTFQEELYEAARKKNPDLLKLIREKRKLDPELETGITDFVIEYIQDIIAKRNKVAPDKFDDYADTTPMVEAQK